MELELANVEELEKLHSQEPITIEQMKTDLNRLTSFIREILKKDQDYGVIPGTGKKPTLYKTGAEKLLKFFRYTPRFHLVEKSPIGTRRNHFSISTTAVPFMTGLLGRLLLKPTEAVIRERRNMPINLNMTPKPPEPQPSVYTFSIVNTLEKWHKKSICWCHTHCNLCLNVLHSGFRGHERYT